MEKTTHLVVEFEHATGLQSTEEEAILIRSITAGDTGRFLDLVNPHLIPLRRIARARTRSDSDAQDIVQETLLKSFTHLGQFRVASNFRTWLYSQARSGKRGGMLRVGG